MITNTGKEIVAKYLIGTAPAYASYIAFGCGSKPRPNITTLSSASSSGTTITVASTNGLWIGAAVSQIISGTGTLASNTLVTQILSTTQFIINTAPTVALSSATLLIEPDQYKQVLDFEMFRVPISSRGYVNDNGINKIIFTAELPTSERYEISEIGIFSAGSNPSAGISDSRTIYAFSDTENWQYSDTISLSTPTTITTKITDTSNIITSSANAINTNADNAGFLDSTRASRYERCRYLNNILMLRGNTSHIVKDTSNNFVIDDSIATHLQITGQTLDFTKNSTSDLLKVAFSLINVDGNSVSIPDYIRVAVEFTNQNETQYAKFETEIDGSLYDFSKNRYFVGTKRFDQLRYSQAFTWGAVNVVKIYTSAINKFNITYKEKTGTTAKLTTSIAHSLTTGDMVTITSVDSTFNGTYVVTGTPTTTTFTYTVSSSGTVASTAVSPNGKMETSRSGYFVALDAIRLDNISSINPLYGMTAYSMVQNLNAETIIKSPNTTNSVEFRMIVDMST
jgi:hypothetical protein